MRKIAFLYSGSSHHHRTVQEPKYSRYLHRVMYMPEFQAEWLDDIDVLIIPSQINVRLMERALPAVHAFLERGGIVAALGAQPESWLPAHNWEFRPTNFWWWLDRNAASGLVLDQPEYGLFRYINGLADATWHYHGVFHPPAGAEIIISVESGGAIMYVDRQSTPGTLIMTTLDPEFHYGSYFMPATERFLDGFLPWLAEGEL
ncbi:hypothetical protein [Paenibacillus protaetiae]|uniref:ThuA-like domain-containing protein n=1 Tax=Paenibacillus protaetiae TaxID=2509456 RepID=A0A4P6F052_9BACL|nr:hypothetical protein [Paenibacillus protaetiae]QAY67449.1 hypothetical protein ET464_14685 [Paenibacillus protaetiae]